MDAVMGTAAEGNVGADVIGTDRSNVWHHLTQHRPLESGDPLVIVKGSGMRVTDARGREYLDATSGGVWTVNVGYGRERIARAVYDQLVQMCYFAQTAGSDARTASATHLGVRFRQM